MTRWTIWTITLALAGTLAARDGQVARVAADNRETVRALAAAGLELLDARVRGDNLERVSWMPENGYVTVGLKPGDRERLASLHATVLDIAPMPVRAEGPRASQTIPQQFGWPRIIDGWPSVYGQAPTITDMNGDGTLEVFLSNIAGNVYMWRPNGTFVLGYPQLPMDNGWSTGSRETAAAGDIDGDGVLEAVFGRWVGRLYAYRYDSFQVDGFPRFLGTQISTSEVALFDLDDDGEDEMVVQTFPNQQSSAPGTVHIYNRDGSELPGWPVQLPQHSESSPSLGDIDGDGEIEIVIGSGENVSAEIKGGLWAFNLDGSICAGFPITSGYSVNCSPSLYDVDGNGLVDILIRVKLRSTEINGIYAFDGSGAVLPGFPAVLPTGGSAHGVPAVADVDGDGTPEIAYGTVEAVDLGKVWLWNIDGSLRPNFPQPVFATWVEESVSLEDVSGDGLPDIVCGTNGVVNDPAQVWAFHGDGNVVSGFPIMINETFSTLETTPTIVDIDGDGDTELFTASHEGTVFAFDTPGVPAADSWPTFKQNPARLGARPEALTGTGEQGNRGTGELPAGFVLEQNYPNPFNPETRFRFGVPEAGYVSVAVYDVRGKRIATIADEWRKAGWHTVLWNGRDGAGRQVASGVYVYRLETGGTIVSRKMMLMK